MRRRALVGVCIGVSSTIGWAQVPAPKTVSPELGADRRVTFRVLAPDAREVT